MPEIQNAKVYSYLRFSDPKQAAGNSAERQIQYAQQWAAANGLPLDESLTLRDEGLSAYHQRHIKQGALGTFLAAVEDGRIAPGSILVVEGLDRLSRAEPILAQAQLAQIINAGITVVTASDGKEYNRERLKAQPMDLVYSLLVMIRAHEESDTKSKRVTASILKLCQRWQDGSYRGLIRNGKDPAWLAWDKDTQRWQLNAARVEAMRTAIRMFITGDGATRIVRELSERGLSLTPSGNNSASNLYKSLKLPALIGVKRIEVGGESFELQNYYPPIITAEEYATLQSLAAKRIRRKGKGEIPGLITGMAICYCGYCGSAMSAQNIMTRAKRPDGAPLDGYRRLLCNNYSLGVGCEVNGSCSVVPIERAIMSWCSDQMNLSALLQGPDQTSAMRARLATAKQHVATVEKQLDRITAAIVATEDGTTPLAFVRKARELETELKTAQVAVSAAEADLVSHSRNQNPAHAEAWAALVDGVEAVDYDQRMLARKLVADTFGKIVVYHHGMNPDNDAAGPHIDLLLISKSGTARALRIHRRTGELIHIEEIGENHALPGTL